MKILGVHNPCLLDAYNLQTILHQQVAECSLSQSPHAGLHFIKGDRREEAPAAQNRSAIWLGQKSPEL